MGLRGSGDFPTGLPGFLSVTAGGGEGKKKKDNNRAVGGQPPNLPGTQGRKIPSSPPSSGDRDGDKIPFCQMKGKKGRGKGQGTRGLWGGLQPVAAVVELWHSTGCGSDSAYPPLIPCTGQGVRNVPSLLC